MISYNLVNILKWNRNDIVLSTPKLLRNIMSLGQSKVRGHEEAVSPLFVVID